MFLQQVEEIRLLISTIDDIQKNVNNIDFNFCKFFFGQIEGALCPISSIACAHISSATLQKSARVKYLLTFIKIKIVSFLFFKKDTRSVTALEFQDEHNLYSCACADRYKNKTNIDSISYYSLFCLSLLKCN